MSPEALAAALVSLAQDGVRVDLQELLVQGHMPVSGDHRPAVKPGALERAIAAANTAERTKPPEPYKCPDFNSDWYRPARCLNCGKRREDH